MKINFKRNILSLKLKQVIPPPFFSSVHAMMSALQSGSCRCRDGDLFGSISILTQHSLWVPEALLVPTCHIRGLSALFLTVLCLWS